MDGALKLFSKPVAEWFEQNIGQPTRTQALGWPAIASGKHALVCAPTGTGKTLCAFLLAIDSLLAVAKKGELTEGVRVLYISPLKALGNDIARNLDRPLEGISQLDPAALAIKKMVRTGDTDNSDRRHMALHPPHILITTPESLYLMLTSKAAKTMFSGLTTVIVDEVHALLDNKRGAHLSLSLERLERLASFQRIGLSATVEPPSEAAGFLGGSDRPVEVVDARAKKTVDILVECPSDDYRGLPEGSIWPEIAKKVYAYAKAQRQTLVFCNNRMVAENVAAAMNRIDAGERLFAATHHGSMDKQRRLVNEKLFQSGELKCLCATSSMELGIDVGDIDLVIQIASPKSSSRGLQRLGRAGHRPDEVSRMRMLPRMDEDALEAALVARAMVEGKVEPMAAPRLCLDVLAQQVVAMGVRETWKVQDILSLARGAYGYKELTMEELRGVLRMLRGDFEHAAGRAVRPRIHWDENENTVHTDDYGRMLAMSGGTIPDRGYYTVVTTEGVRVGELDEEFVYEARMGDRFMLGAFTWAITRIQHDRVVVAPSGGPARAPFWRGDAIGRPSRMGEFYGRELAGIEAAKDMPQYLFDRFPIDGATNRALTRVLQEQLEIFGCLPTDRRIVAEHFSDEAGESFLAFHCVLGGRVNHVLSIALEEAASQLTGRGVQSYHTDDGILLHFIGEESAPTGLLQMVDPDRLGELLLRVLPSTPLFAISFRHASATALMLGSGQKGTRVPLWVQRLRGAEALTRAAETRDHPMVIEAYRECFDRVFEVERAAQLLRDVRAGHVKVVEARSEHPSKLTSELKSKLVLVYTYAEANTADVVAKGALADLRSVVPPSMATQRRVEEARDADALYALLLRCGVIQESTLRGALPLARELIEQGRARLVEGLLVAAHEAELLAQAKEGDEQALRALMPRFVAMAGEVAQAELSQVFGDAALPVAEELVEREEWQIFRRGGRDYYAGAQDFLRAVALAARERRTQISTAPASAYAAMLPLWQEAQGETPPDQLAGAVKPLLGMYLDRSLWEEVVLPARVARYRPRDLDRALLSGELTWRYDEGKVAFFSPEQAFLPPVELDEPVYRALKEGGAQFALQLSRKSGVAGAALEAALEDLVQRGLAVCDGFAPHRGGRKNPDVKQRVRARSIALSGEGRWEAAAPPEPKTPQDSIQMLCARYGVLSRECAEREGIAWQGLSDVLRRMEYAGEIRRGYFVEGLSGAQFVLAQHFDRVRAMLEDPRGAQVLCAVDPAGAWGQLLRGADFLCVSGTGVALIGGKIAAIAERKGAVLRAGEDTGLFAEGVMALAAAFRAKRLWPGKTRLSVKQYPDGAGEALRAAGFVPEMLDFTLWRD